MEIVIGLVAFMLGMICHFLLTRRKTFDGQVTIDVSQPARDVFRFTFTDEDFFDNIAKKKFIVLKVVALDTDADPSHK